MVVRPERVDEAEDGVVSLFTYGGRGQGRLDSDACCAPMPRPVFALCEQLWLAAMPHLCEESRRNPPSHCQMLIYYGLLNSKMGTSHQHHPKHKLSSLTAPLSLMRILQGDTATITM